MPLRILHTTTTRTKDVTSVKNIPIGEVLKEYGYITQEQLSQALAYQKADGTKRLGTILIDMGYVTERQVLSALAQRLNQQLITLDTFPVEIDAVQKIPKTLAVKYNLIAIAESGGRLTVATSDPLNFYAVEDIRLVTNMPIVVCLAERASIDNAIDYYYAEVKAKEAVTSANLVMDDPAITFDEEAVDDSSLTPVVKLLNSLLIRGYSTNASDIHIEPFEDKTIVRMRIDGMIVEYVTLSSTLHPSLIARTKILANLDIAEKRVPQDGHFKTTIDGFEMNIRVSIIPTVFGEKAVLRYLNSNVTIDHSGQFGMTKSNYDKLISMLKSPHGIIYLTGPTGSGKTTTLYMALEHLAKGQVNISTIEDPVERNLSRINQMQVNNTAGLTFEAGLRALLRQDPDIIMVGETRDNETASISVRAAITGHLVLSTLHTNDAISAIVRLQDMGVEAFMTANSLTGMVAQRLVRKICPYCKKSIPTTDLERALLGEDVQSISIGEGCHLCNHTGYKGRVAVHEVIMVDKTMRRMIANKETIDAIYDYVLKSQELITLKDSAMTLVKAGMTTMDELHKIIYYID